MEPTLTKHIGKLPKMDQLIQSKIEDNLKQQKSNININNSQIFTEEVLQELDKVSEDRKKK